MVMVSMHVCVYKSSCVCVSVSTVEQGYQMRRIGDGHYAIHTLQQVPKLHHTAQQ